MAELDASQRAVLVALPKVELHRHLEGSLRLSTLREIAIKHQLDLPTRDDEDLRPFVQVMNDEPNMRNFLDKFAVLRRFYQSPDWIHRLTYEVVEDAVRDNVRYLELRFTPVALAKARGFPLHEVTHWVLQAVAKARQDFPSIEVELIASVNRQELESAEKVMRIAVDHKEDIVALDLAGDEVNYPTLPFAGLFQEARQAGLGITVHAGEWTGAATVRSAIEDLGAQRIGHGVRVVEDPHVAALARERGVAFEVCPTSNLHTGVIRRLGDHPLRDMLYLGLAATINTDDPSVSNITLTNEYEVAQEHLDFKLADLQRVILTAAGAAFRPPEARARLVEKFKAELGLAA